MRENALNVKIWKKEKRKLKIAEKEGMGNEKVRESLGKSPEIYSE